MGMVSHEGLSGYLVKWIDQKFLDDDREHIYVAHHSSHNDSDAAHVLANKYSFEKHFAQFKSIIAPRLLWELNTIGVW